MNDAYDCSLFPLIINFNGFLLPSCGVYWDDCKEQDKETMRTRTGNIELHA